MSKTHDELFRGQLLRAYLERDDVAHDKLLGRLEAMQAELHRLRQGDPMDDLVQTKLARRE